MVGDIPVGRCGECGGVVTTPRVWYGVQRAPQTCESCGAVVDEAASLPPMKMRPRQPIRTNAMAACPSCGQPPSMQPTTGCPMHAHYGTYV